MLLMILAFSWASQARAFSLFGKSTEAVKAENGVITIDASTIANNASRHYSYQDGNTLVRFFLVKDAKGALRAAMDACDVCWHENKGYSFHNNTMRCDNCGMMFALQRIGAVRGGCNPHPIVFTVEGTVFTVTAEELLSAARYFPENGK